MPPSVGESSHPLLSLLRGWDVGTVAGARDTVGLENLLTLCGGGDGCEILPLALQPEGTGHRHCEWPWAQSLGWGRAALGFRVTQS